MLMLLKNPTKIEEQRLLGAIRLLHNGRLLLPDQSEYVLQQHDAHFVPEARSHGRDLPEWQQRTSAIVWDYRPPTIMRDSGLKERLDSVPQPTSQLDPTAFASFLRSCKALLEGKLLHAQIIRSGREQNTYLGNLLVQMYGNCAALRDASRAFDKMNHRNVFSWAMIIGAYVQNGYSKQVFQLSRHMHLEGVMPDRVIFLSILCACGNLAELHECIWVHICIMGSGLQTDVVLGTALVSGYAKCGSLKHARMVFDEMQDRNIFSWNAIISAFTQHGRGSEALVVFQQMQIEGIIPDKVTFISIVSACHSPLAIGQWMHARIVDGPCESSVALGNAIIGMYGKCGNLKEAQMMFEKMHERNVVSWSTIMAAYAQHGDANMSVKVFQQMQHEGVTPDRVSYITVLSACASQTALTEGIRLHACILDSKIESDVVVGTAVVNMYGKCGRLEAARSAFDRMPERNAVSWNVMIAAYSQHGQVWEVLPVVQQMQVEGLFPNEVTLASIIHGCSKQEALGLGKQMHVHVVATEFKSDVLLRTALINMYRKCGCLQHAQRLFDT